MILNLLVNLSFSFYNFNQVPVDMNHIPSHSLRMPSLLRFIFFFYFERKEGHELLQIMHQDNLLIISL